MKPRSLCRTKLGPTCAALLALTVFAPAWAQSPAANRVRVVTNQGSFVIQLDRERAPLTVDNFLSYVQSGFYSNTLLHRVVTNFVIQGGGVTPDYKPKQANKPIPNEAGNGLRNLRGTVGLARAANPHSGDCQFYVNIADNPDLDPLPTRWGYAVFGRVVEGMEVIDRIGSVATGPNGPFKSDAPLKPIVIEKVELLAPEVATPAAPLPAPPATPPPATPPAAAPAAEPKS
jgi:cyclophilin family peptidyl-prolyl cis-trans isomerase